MEKLDIINEAIAGVDQSLILLSDLENSPSSVILNRAYSNSFKKLFGLHKWSFLIQTELLSNVEIQNNKSNFSYKHSLPENFGRLIGVSNQSLSINPLLFILPEFKIYDNTWVLNEFAVQNGFIFTNYSPIFIVYLSKDENAVQFASPEYVVALINGIQAFISISLKQNISLKNQFLAEFNINSKIAINADILQSKKLVSNNNLNRNNFRSF